MEITNGLKPLPKDERDFPVGAVFDLPDISELPPEYVVGLPTVKNQKDSDFCAAFASCAISELQEEVELCPEWVFAVGKMIEGDVESFGLDLRSVCQAHQKYGAIEATDAPYSLAQGRTVDFLRRIENWPESLFDKALVHKKGSFFAVKSADSDYFDTIRRTLWKFRNEKCGVIFGVLWSWTLAQVYMEMPGQGGGHALAQIGWTTTQEATPRPMMFIQNSYGPEIGVGGRHYFSREVTNAFAEKFGCFMFHDIPKEHAQYYIDNGIKISDNWLMQLWKRVKKFFLNLRQNVAAVAGRLNT